MSEQEPPLVEEAREAFEIVDEAFQKCREARGYVQSANEYVLSVWRSLNEELIPIITAWSVRPMLGNAFRTACNAALNWCIDILWITMYMDSALKSVEAAYNRTEQARSASFRVYKDSGSEEECGS